MDLLYCLSKLPTSGGLTVIDARARTGYYRIEGNLSRDMTEDDLRKYFRELGSTLTLGDVFSTTGVDFPRFVVELKRGSHRFL